MKVRVNLCVEESLLDEVDTYIKNRYHGAFSRSQFVSVLLAEAMNKSNLITAPEVIVCD